MSAITCPGFKATGIHAGLKNGKEKDLGLIFSEVPANAAGVFTTNRIKAAPVLLDMERVAGGTGRAIIVNSRNANCCTGERGMQDAVSMGRFIARKFDLNDNDVFVASTGVIGAPLPIEKIESAVPELAVSLSPEGFKDCAEAIMTTDTRPKLFRSRAKIDGKTFTIVGMAKGSGMIAPNMATMLCFLCTDISAEPEILKKLLVNAVRKSLNRIVIDGDTSTNDTTLIMASGLSGVCLDTDDRVEVFQETLDDVLNRLARELVRDGEGVTKLVQVDVTGAASERDARTIAETVANSPLVKTALFGEDANWGRIAAAAGRAGVPLDPNRMDIYFDDVQMVAGGLSCGEAAELQATEVLKKSEMSITVDLNTGDGRASILTCDFSIDYVKINADYRS